MAKLSIAQWNVSDFPFGSTPPETKDDLPVNVNKVNSVVEKVKKIDAHIVVFNNVHRTLELAQAASKAPWKNSGYTNFVATNRDAKGETGVNNGTAILSKLFIRDAWQINIRSTSEKWQALLELPDSNVLVRAPDVNILGCTVRLNGKEDRFVYIYAVTLPDFNPNPVDFGKGATDTLSLAERAKGYKYQQAKRTLAIKAIVADVRSRKLDLTKDYVVVAGTLSTPFAFLAKNYPEFQEEKTIQTILSYQPDPEMPKLFFHAIDPTNTGASSNGAYVTFPKGYLGEQLSDIDYDHVIMSEGLRTPAPSWKLDTADYESELYNPKRKYGLGEVIILTKSSEASKANVLYRRTTLTPSEGHADADFDTTAVPGITLMKTAGRYTLPTETPTTKWEPYYPWYRDGWAYKTGERFTYLNRVYEVKKDITEAEHTKATDIITGQKVSAVDVSKVKIPSSTHKAVIVTTGVDT